MDHASPLDFPTVPRDLDEVPWKHVGATLRHWSDADAFKDGDLGLEPLHPRHTTAWLHQTRDEHLLAMTQLPRFRDEHQARCWIEARWAATCEPVSHQRVQRYTFAIVDADSQFMGSISVIRRGAAAYFSFWVGVDHQRRGIGTRASQISYRVAQSHLGIRNLFTASYRHNHPSHRVLLRGGWTRLPFRGEPPSHVLDFFHRPMGSGATPTRARTYATLARLLRDIDSDFVLAPRPSRHGPEAYPGGRRIQSPRQSGVA